MCVCFYYDGCQLGSVIFFRIITTPKSNYRCAAVVNPLRKRQLSARSTFLMILAIWLLATLLSLPGSIPARIDKQYFYSIPKEQLNERRICHNDFEHKLL